MLRRALSNGFGAGRWPRVVAGLCAAFSVAAGAQGPAPKTVCTITINSADERDTFRRFLPPDKYRFVELVEHGRPDWLAAACRQGVTCDALVISGHFDGGTEFYSDHLDGSEFLAVSELERASCSASCSRLFSQLEDVYLFGCNTLKAEPKHIASAEIARSLVRSGHSPADAARLSALLGERYGQSNRDRLRHIFKDVPVLYGFASKAPLGRSAGPLLDRYFRSAPPDEVASGRVSPTLVDLFAPSSMTVAAGVTDADPHAGLRQDVCGLAAEGPSDAQKIAFLHRLLERDMADVRMLLDRLEDFVASIGPAQRQAPGVAAALRAIADDGAARERYLEFARDADEPAVQTRMMALAHALGWLSAAQQQAEFVRMFADRMAHAALGRSDVDLACTSPLAAAGPGLAGQLLATGAAQPAKVAHAAVLACLGSREAHARTVLALLSPGDDDAAIAQVYLRHRPLAGAGELRAVTSGIARLAASAAQVRALEALARQRIADAESLQAVARLFTLARSLDVQRAAAGVLIRADLRELGRADLARSLRQHRLKSPDGDDVIDALIRLLQAA